MPIWIPGILNAWSIQISATVARFRGNVRSRKSGSMPLIVGKKNKITVSSRNALEFGENLWYKEKHALTFIWDSIYYPQ